MGGHNCTTEISNQGRMKSIRFNQIEIRNCNVDTGKVSKNKIKKFLVLNGKVVLRKSKVTCGTVNNIPSNFSIVMRRKPFAQSKPGTLKSANRTTQKFCGFNLISNELK
jgi:hypothetical protein